MYIFLSLVLQTSALLSYLCHGEFFTSMSVEHFLMRMRGGKFILNMLESKPVNH